MRAHRHARRLDPREPAPRAPARHRTLRASSLMRSKLRRRTGPAACCAMRCACATSVARSASAIFRCIVGAGGGEARKGQRLSECERGKRSRGATQKAEGRETERERERENASHSNRKRSMREQRRRGRRRNRERERREREREKREGEEEVKRMKESAHERPLSAEIVLALLRSLRRSAAPRTPFERARDGGSNDALRRAPRRLPVARS